MAAVNEHDDTFDTLAAIWDDAEFDIINSSNTNTINISNINNTQLIAPISADVSFDLFSHDIDQENDDPLSFLPSNTNNINININNNINTNGWSSFLDDSCPFRRRTKGSNVNFSPASSLKRALRPDPTVSKAYSPLKKRARTTPTITTTTTASPPFSPDNNAPLVPRRSRSTAPVPNTTSISISDGLPLGKKKDAPYDVLPPVKKAPIMEEISSSEDEADRDDGEDGDIDVPLTKLKKRATVPVMLDTRDGVPIDHDNDNDSNINNDDGYITPNLSGRLASILLMSASTSAFSSLSLTSELSSSSSNSNSNSNINSYGGKNFAPVHKARSCALPCVSSAVAAVTMAAKNYSRSLAMK